MVAVEHRHQPKAAQQSNFCNVAAPTADEAAEGAEKRAAVDAALAAAPRSIRGARYCIGSQQHFYMEPQVREALRHSVALLAIRVCTTVRLKMPARLYQDACQECGIAVCWLSISYGPTSSQMRADQDCYANARCFVCLVMVRAVVFAHEVDVRHLLMSDSADIWSAAVTHGGQVAAARSRR